MAYDNQSVENNGSPLTLVSTGPLALKNQAQGEPGATFNVIRNAGDSLITVSNSASFTNNSYGVTWIPFDMGGGPISIALSPTSIP